jgi:ArsR family transcriptional regulator
MEIYSKTFKTLSDNTRLRIMRLLATTRQELCICEIMDSLGLAQYNVSKHVRELKNAGLLKEKKEGKFVMYSLVRPKDAFHKHAIKAVGAIPRKYFLKDKKHLKRRLSLRKCGKCVVGMGGHKFK